MAQQLGLKGCLPLASKQPGCPGVSFSLFKQVKLLQ